jgi:hypothetical protein
MAHWRFNMRAYRIVVFSSLWLLGVALPALAQDEQELPAAIQGEQDLIDDVVPELKRAASVPLSIEQAISQAMRTNPEVSTAEAKVREMQASLRHARLTVARDVTVAYHKWENARQSLKRHQEVARQTKEGVAPIVRQGFAEAEWELMLLLGVRVDEGLEDGEFDARVEVWDSVSGKPRRIARAGGRLPSVAGQPAARPEIPQRFQEVLQKKVPVDFIDQPLSDVLEYLCAAVENKISFLTKVQNDTLVTLKLRHDVTLEVALEAFADQNDWCFVFRDYGVLVVPRDAAVMQYRGAAIPKDTPTP